MTEKKRKEDCPCTNTSCSRHGLCDECLAAHRATNSATACGKK